MPSSAPATARSTTRGTYPTFIYHVIGYGGRSRLCTYRDDGTLDLDALLDRRASENSRRIVYLANPDNPSGRFIGRDEMARFYEALAARYVCCCSTKRTPISSTSGDLLAANLRRSHHSPAHLFEGLRDGRRAHRLRACDASATCSTFQKIRLQYGVNRNAQIGALASLEDDEFRDGVVPRRRARATTTTRSRASSAAPTSNRATNFVCIDMGSGAARNRVMDELLARGVWVRKPGAPPARLVTFA